MTYTLEVLRELVSPHGYQHLSYEKVYINSRQGYPLCRKLTYFPFQMLLETTSLRLRRLGSLTLSLKE